MKLFLIAAAALTLGGTAIAQDTSNTGAGGTGSTGTMSQTQPDGTMQDPAGTSTTGTPMQQPSQDSSMQPSGQPMQQPATDSSTMPTDQPSGSMSNGSMSNGSMANNGMMSPQASTGAYPRCSATVTDHCTQGMGGKARPTRRRR